MDMSTSSCRAHSFGFKVKSSEEIPWEEMKTWTDELGEEIRKDKISQASKWSDQLREISSLIKSANCKSKGLSCSTEVVKLMDRCQILLGNSFTVCTESAPLFLSAFKCHYLALNYIRDGENDLAIQTMAEIKKSAKKLASDHEKSKNEFSLFIEETINTLALARDEAHPIHCKIRAIEEMQKTGEGSSDNSTELSELKTSLSSVYSLINSIYPIFRIILNNHWAVSENSSKHLSGYLEDIEYKLEYGRPRENIEKDWRESYLQWRSLADVNKIMTAAFKEAIDQFDNIKVE